MQLKSSIKNLRKLVLAFEDKYNDGSFGTLDLLYFLFPMATSPISLSQSELSSFCFIIP